MMLALGLFVFALKTVPYQQLQRHTQWRHPSNSRIGQRPAHQFTGTGEDSITLSGTLFPEVTGGQISITMLRTMADTGKAWPLIRGDGIIYGEYVIEDMSETGTLFFRDGAPRQIDFSLKITRVDETTPLGDLAAMLPLLLP